MKCDTVAWPKIEEPEYPRHGPSSVHQLTMVSDLTALALNMKNEGLILPNGFLNY